MKEKIIKLIGMAFTIIGVYMVVFGGMITDGLLTMILGELVDIKYR